MLIKNTTCILLIFNLFSCVSKGPRTEESDKPENKCNFVLYKKRVRDKKFFDNSKVFKESKKKGDIFNCTLQFSNQNIKVNKIISAGFASIIFETEDNQILRIEASRTQPHDLRDFSIIYQDLSKNSVPVVMSKVESNFEFILHEKLDIKSTLEAYLINPSLDKNDQIFLNFLEFCRHLYKYVFIADLHAGNIVLLKNNKWLAMDFGASSKDKFIDYHGMQFKHFKPSHNLREKIISLKKASISNEEIYNALIVDQELAKEIKVNPITHPDKATEKYMIIPTEWKEDIFKIISMSRIDHIQEL